MPKKYKYDSTFVYHLPTGKSIRYHIRADSKKEFEQKKLELKQSEQKGIDLFQNSTFGYWATEWLNNTKLNQGYSRGNEECYTAAVKQLLARFQDTEFKNMTMNAFQEFVNDLAAENPNTGKPMSAHYLQLIVSTAKDIAMYASGSHVKGVSAFYNVVIPRTAPRKTVDALTEEQINMVVNFKHEMQLPAMIGTFAGLRRGETLALQWKHIDFERGCIHVAQSLNWNPNQPEIKQGGKTVNAVRTVYIPPVLVKYLRDYKNTLDAYPAPSMFVCCNQKTGKPYTQSEFRRRWNHYNQSLNCCFGGFTEETLSTIPAARLPMKIEPLHTHQCRHTFATLCYLQGLSIPDTMQELGHANPSVTIRIYTDLKNYNKLELSEDFKKKLLTSYRIPLAPERDTRTAGIS